MLENQGRLNTQCTAKQLRLNGSGSGNTLWAKRNRNPFETRVIYLTPRRILAGLWGRRGLWLDHGS